MRGASHSRPRPIAFKSWYELWVAPYGGAYGANWVGVSGWVCLGGCVWVGVSSFVFGFETKNKA